LKTIFQQGECVEQERWNGDSAEAALADADFPRILEI
jgi:hypothetical protein